MAGPAMITELKVLGVYPGIIEVDFSLPRDQWEGFGTAIEEQFPGLFWDSNLLSSFRIRGRVLPREETFEALIKDFYREWQHDQQLESINPNR